MLSRVLVARRHFNAHHEPGTCQHICMQYVRRASWFLWIITDDCPFLMPVKQFYRRIYIDDIILAK